MDHGTFGELTPRMKQFREELIEAKPQVCVERAVITTETYQENQDQPLAIKRALIWILASPGWQRNPIGFYLAPTLTSH